MQFDENGWAMGAISPLPVEGAWSLLSPEPEARIDEARWAHHAETFFRARVALVQPKRYPAGTLPLSDAALFDVACREAAETARVFVVTTPMDRATDVRRAAVLGAEAIGGAGMDALIPRARRLWQVRAEEGRESGRAALLLTAVIAAMLLAPIVPPGGGTIFGVKGARERLSRW